MTELADNLCRISYIMELYSGNNVQKVSGGSYGVAGSTHSVIFIYNIVRSGNFVTFRRELVLSPTRKMAVSTRSENLWKY